MIWSRKSSRPSEAILNSNSSRSFKDRNKALHAFAAVRAATNGRLDKVFGDTAGEPGLFKSTQFLGLSHLEVRVVNGLDRPITSAARPNAPALVSKS